MKIEFLFPSCCNLVKLLPLVVTIVTKSSFKRVVYQLQQWTCPVGPTAKLLVKSFIPTVNHTINTRRSRQFAVTALSRNSAPYQRMVENNVRPILSV